MITQAKVMTEQRLGLVPGVAHLAIEVAERTQKTAIGVLQDVRGELRITVDATLDFAEKTFVSLMRFSRKLTQRIDEAATETLGSADRLLGNTVETARDTARMASELATVAVDGTIGRRSVVS